MIKKLLCAITVLTFYCSSQAQVNIALDPYVSGFDNPVDIANAGDTRLFIVEKDGYIRIIKNGLIESAPFLDIDGRVRSSGNEQGLLGLAFHPDYANNGYFYVNYTDNGGNTRISRFTVSNNINIADPDSEQIIYVVSQPYTNHNGGDLNFGPDGYLYIGLGDGGSGGDPGNFAQNPQSALGKMLRIDIDNGFPYSIPADNPFVGDASTLDEIWALGLRNPWRFSFDDLTGDLWIADVGQDDLEEIDFQPASSAGGENYGWRCYEGTMPFNTGGCPPATDMTAPIHVYGNSFSTGCSVTGGYVYRGARYPRLYGTYLYADYCTGKFWGIQPNGVNGWFNEEVGDLDSYEYATFGEDESKELYVAGFADGVIYKIIDPDPLPVELSEFAVSVTEERQVLVEWTTETEANSDYFEIQRSADANVIENIGRVDAATYSEIIVDYQFTDETPMLGTTYYRLKQVDLDGYAEYSDWKKVEIERPYLIPNVYPNPVREGESLTMDFGENLNTTLQLTISDLSGRSLYSNAIDTETGLVNITLPEKLNAGIYLINGEFNGYRFHQKLVIGQ